MKLEIYGNERYEKACADLERQYEGLLERVKTDRQSYVGSLGWLYPRTWANQAILEQIKSIAAEIRANAQVLVLIGVGGSNNSARAMIKALGESGNIEIVYAGNTLSSYALHKVYEYVKDKSFYVHCIAKNFETLEPGSSFKLFRSLLREKYKERYGQRVIATGSEGSLFDEISRKEGYRFLAFPWDVGGRYTAFTAVGLLPMAVAGLDIEAFLQGAEDMQKELFAADAGDNAAYRYACLRNLYYREGYRIELLASFEPRFRYFYKWWIQLFGESEGKEDKGIFPASADYSEELHALGQFMQEGTPLVFESFLDVQEEEQALLVPRDGIEDGFAYIEKTDFREINRKVFRGTLEAHSKRFPCLCFGLERLDTRHLGALMYFFMFSCYLSCEMMGVNPFNQEGVEEYKRCAFRMLGK